MEKKKSKFRIFLFALFITVFSFGILGIAGYFTYNAIFKKIDNKLREEETVNPIDNNDDEKNEAENEKEKKQNNKNIVVELREKDKAIIFNRKESDGSESLNKNFVVGNLTFVEKPISIDSDNTPVYYLGSKGLTFLNNMFKKRAMFGPEINALKKVNINVETNLVSQDNTNGLYLPRRNEMYIFIKNIINNNRSLMTQSVEKRAEIIFGTLMHEYSHHIDNMYNKAIKKNDEYANNDLIEYDGDHDFKHFEINNKKFLNDFRINLNYHDDTNRNKFLRSKDDFYYDKNKIPVYKDFSSNDLFRAANVDISAEEKKRFEVLNSNKYFFNNNKYQSINFSSPANLKSIRYLFSFTELFPREMIKLSLGPNYWFYNPNKSLVENFFFFVKSNKELIFNAAGDDILKNLNVIRRNSLSLNNELVTFAPNWVFKDQIETFRSNIFNIKNNKYETPFENVGDQFHKGLFKAYIDLLGWGELISFTNYNLHNDKKDTLNFGGYFQLPTKILNDEKFSNLDKKIILVEKNNEGNFEELDFDMQDYNFIAKKKWNSIYRYYNKNQKQENYYNEDWIYPNLFKEGYEYVSYFIKDLNKNKIKQKFRNNKFDIRIWIDLNQDGKYDLNDKKNNEVISLLNDNEWNNSGDIFYQRYLNNKRKSTTFRRFYAPSIKYEWFKLNQDLIDKKYYYSIENY
ncbi:MYPU_1760 family metalloprotease [Metamycoplasma gateae]|uniref:Uncharacterized protein n=1 Tax=Metamycoplasma gateae TaxID=35769 RepID=A0ABZ2AGW0_9BACT|nr:hypothetical protein V2E26_02970 [Metamycoplasma gateae]